MQQAGYSSDEIDSVVNLINSHSFSDKQLETVEEKVLFDADKLEYISVGRLLWMCEGIQRGLLDAQVGRKYVLALQERIVSVVQALHFPYTRQIMANNLAQFIPILPMCKKKYPELLANVEKDEFVRAIAYLESRQSDSRE
jgi:HD superfamily phosphodiesterase